MLAALWRQVADDPTLAAEVVVGPASALVSGGRDDVLAVAEAIDELACAGRDGPVTTSVLFHPASQRDRPSGRSTDATAASPMG